MERLTEWIPSERRAIPRTDLRSNGHERCTTRLAEYEDTGLTPEQVQELKERDTAKRPKEYEDKYYCCPVCGNVLMNKWEKYPTELMDRKNGLPFCLSCGQRLDWSE